MEKSKPLKSSRKKMHLTSKEKLDEALSKLSSEDLLDVGKGSVNLSKEKIKKGSGKKITGTSSEKILKQTDRKAAKVFRKKHSGSKESLSFSAENTRSGSKESTKKSFEFAGISRSKEFIKEYRAKSKKSASAESLKSAEILGDGSAESDKKKQRIWDKAKDTKKTPKRKSRPYYYNESLDGIPESLQSISDKSPQVTDESSRSHDRLISKNVKETKQTMPIKKRPPRPFCYDEELDGITKSLMSIKEPKTSEKKVSDTKNYPLVQPSTYIPDVPKDNRAKETQASAEAESESEDSESDTVQQLQTKVAQKLNSIKDWNSAKDDAISAQKLVNGENVANLTYNYIFARSDLDKTLKLEHKFLWKQQRHISDFCKAETMERGKNRSSNVVCYNEGAIHLLQTMNNDSRYIHASQINTRYGYFIIAQGPTEQSLIDFFRMLWQYHVLFVVCLEPLTNPENCYPYFSFRCKKIVKVAERYFIETQKVTETSVANLLLYEVMLTNMEIKTSENKRHLQIMQYNKWTHGKTISPVLLIKMITVMKTAKEKEKNPIVVHGSYGIQRSAIFVIISLLMRQIAENHQMSILNIAKAVCMRRYGVLRFLADYRLILQSALCYAKQCDLIEDEKKYMDAMTILEGKNRDM